MGAISDGSFNYLKEYSREQRAQYTYLNGGGYETHSTWGSALATALPSLFMTLSSKLEGAEVDTPVTSDKTDLSPEAVDIQKDIDNVLQAAGCADISEVQTKLQTSQSELKDINSQITSNSREIRTLNSTISDLEKAVKAVGNDSLDVNEINKQIVDLKQKVTELEAEKKKLETKQEEKVSEVEKYSQALENLKTLQKQLKKVEGRDAIEELVNNESKDFSKAFKELRDAIQSGNQDVIDEKALALKTSYDNYVSAHPHTHNSMVEKGYNSMKKYVNAAKKAV